jgi:hypothetical protein
MLVMDTSFLFGADKIVVQHQLILLWSWRGDHGSVSVNCSD